MKVKYQALLLLMFLMLAAGFSFADEGVVGKVTSIDRKAQVIEVDGRRYYCPKHLVQSVEYGERVKLDDIVAECERE